MSPGRLGSSQASTELGWGEGLGVVVKVAAAKGAVTEVEVRWAVVMGGEARAEVVRAAGEMVVDPEAEGWAEG